MSILVLGAGGMAGHVVTTYLREQGFEVETLSATHALDKQTHLIDVTDTKKFKAFLQTKTYDVVVNCIGLLVKPSDEHKDLAVYINAYLPRLLEAHYQHTPTKVIHISTDGVFSSKNPPYIEQSAYDTDTFYGRTKALGEIINDKDLTLRMSIMGPDRYADGTGLFHWFYGQTGQISGYTNAIWHGITTIQLAKGIKEAIDQKISGVCHLVPKKPISKFELLKLCKEVFKRDDIEVSPAKGAVDFDGTLAVTRKDFQPKVPDYRTMIYDMKIWIKDHPELYGHYQNQSS